MAVAFNSFDEAEEYIRLHESRTKIFHHLQKLPSNLMSDRVLKFLSPKFHLSTLPGKQGSATMDLAEYTEPDDPNRKRRRLRRIKKMGCPAIIKIKTVIYLPRFKVSDPVTKYKIRLAVNEMRTQEVRPEDKQMVFVLFCNKHQNHPGLKYTLPQ
ncbi:uncharacterized protein LOC127867954 [Dreissena polymorpha]|uniref:uncharacterized protein LOC127867954 n=1 Tax=Dreissena polymorpha TaxID=45954 RepID=UPI0022656DBB|nr:uncharacterized protein LOC127867954 [Dreissena polymorpha]